ncbi:MAG TPA: hypothetical protein VF137_12410 [Candidatus Dormibacteraeota bacterium]
MPQAWIERLPALIDPIAGVPDTWRARLEDGTPVAVRRMPETDPAQAGRVLQRLKSAGAVRTPRVVRLLGAAHDTDGVSVIYAADLGTGLDRALQPGPVGVGAGLVLANHLFEGLEAIHAAGTAHGAVGEHAVRLFEDGGARLWAFAPALDDVAEAKTADVRAAAQLVCRALGLPLEWSAADPLRETERSAPALAATLRAIARGSLPLEAQGALSAVNEAAGSLAEDGALAGGRAELAARAGQRSTPPPKPRLPVVSLPAPAAPTRGVLYIAGGVVAAVLFLTGVGLIGYQAVAGRHSSSPPPVAGAQHSPAATASPSPNALPSVPPSNGDVKSVVESPQNECSPGATCTIEVDVHFTKAAAPEDIAWQFELVDSCTGDATYVDGNHIMAQTGWVHVIGDTRVSIPSGHPLAVLAVTTTPSLAASSPLLITSGSC